LAKKEDTRQEGKTLLGSPKRETRQPLYDHSDKKKFKIKLQFDDSEPKRKKLGS